MSPERQCLLSSQAVTWGRGTVDHSQMRMCEPAFIPGGRSCTRTETI